MSQTQSSAPAPGGVLIVGSITADLTTFSSRLPARGETILGDDFTLVLGGKGANQAVAAGLAGGNAHMVGCVGTDLFSELVTGGLRDAGVHIDHVRTVPGPTGIAHIRVDDSGENDIVMVPLANSSLSEEQIDTAFDELGATCRVLLTQLEIPWALTQYAIRKANAAGLTVVLDPAPAATLDEAIWPLVDIVTPNETEASILTGIAVVDEASAIEAGRWFTARGATSALITMAAAGAVLVTADAVEHFDSIQVDAVDTTAAGDAFAGYLGASLADGYDVTDAIRRAIAAGALTVTRRGASPSLPHRTEVDALAAGHAGAVR
ncbi:ribokinase [Mycetocola manganoxydans]|uniref:Ribokinase n=1 Tax=Mycetocola manganoxydans TaxID=699879 RepID=A0A3L6ZZ84_9MICO|nr:ribokinase [Mycetocola manganoxydans]RLP73015.1 ribokinase [Mycetocola manganoxydans]GHD44535.1 ribokinase [Mycetocola manganoxydans]